MNDYSGPSIDPTNPQATLRATSELMRDGDFSTTERLLGWALDFNPEHAGLLRRMSELRWDEGKVDESLVWAEQALAADRGNAESYSYLGLLSMRQGRYAEAEELLVRAVEIKPDNAGYLRRLADILTHLGRGEDAITVAERASTLQPQELHGYNVLTGLQERYGDFEGAETTILTAISLLPESAAALRRMANFRLARGDVDTAMVWAARARDTAPSDPANDDLDATIALLSGDLAAAEDALRTAASLHLTGGHYKRRLSDVLLRRGNREGALCWAEKAVADHPQDPSCHSHLANLRTAVGRHDDAFASLEAAVGQIAKPAEATGLMRKLSSLAQQRGDGETARGWAERAIAANAFDAENYAHLASLHLQQGALAAAQEAARRAVELAPGSAGHMRRLSDIAWRRDDAETAFDWAARAVAAHPTDVQNYAHQATVLMRQGRNDAAEQPLARAVELAPTDVGLLTRLSDLKQRLGREEEAFTLAERAIIARPSDLGGYNHMATLHLRLGNLEPAEAILRRAAEIEPTNVPLLRRLAETTRRRGNLEAARAWLRQALDADPRDPHSYNQLASLELECGDNAAAEAALTRATELAGANPAFHRRLSDVLSRRGDEQGALYWAETAVRDFPGDPAGLIQLGNLQLGAGRLDEAEAAFRTASERASTPAQALGPLHRLSDVATRRNDIRGALAWSAKGIGVAPREAGAYNHLAGIHLAYGNLAAAETAARKAVDIAPTDVGALRRLCEIALRQGRLDEALGLARQAVAANLGDPHSHNQEASIHLARRDFAAAQASMETALRLAPAEVAFLRRAIYLGALADSGAHYVSQKQ